MAPSSAAIRALPIAPKHCDSQQDPISPFELEFATLGKAANSEIYGSCCVVPITGRSPYGLQTVSIGCRRQDSAPDQRRIELDVENDMNRYDEHQRAEQGWLLAADI
jgi:hypothetical protein